MPLRARQGRGPVPRRVLRFGLLRDAAAPAGRRGRRAGRQLHEGLHRRKDRALRHGLRHDGALPVARHARCGRERHVGHLLLPAQGGLLLQTQEQLGLSAADDRRRGLAAGRLLDGDGRARHQLAVRALQLRLLVAHEPRRDAHRGRAREDSGRVWRHARVVPGAGGSRARAGWRHLQDAGRGLLAPQGQRTGQHLVHPRAVARSPRASGSSATSCARAAAPCAARRAAMRPASTRRCRGS